MFFDLTLQFSQFDGESPMQTERFTKADENTHDGHIDLNGTGATQYA